MNQALALRQVICGQCSTPFETRWTRQLFCPPCGEERRAKASGRGVQARKAGLSSAVQEIAESSSETKSNIFKLFDPPEYEWVVAYRVKFGLEVSKNRRWSNNGKGAVFLSAGVRSYQDYIVHATKRALSGQTVRTNKLWLSFFVQKTNHKSDAINVIDTLCDAIKVAAGIDDNWFCIDRVDWEVKKTDPEIFIKIGQESAADAIVCSHCGDIQGLENFGKKSTGPFGRSRVCRACVSVLSRHAQAARKT